MQLHPVSKLRPTTILRSHINRILRPLMCQVGKPQNHPEKIVPEWHPQSEPFETNQHPTKSLRFCQRELARQPRTQELSCVRFFTILYHFLLLKKKKRKIRIHGIQSVTKLRSRNIHSASQLVSTLGNTNHLNILPLPRCAESKKITSQKSLSTKVQFFDKWVIGRMRWN